MTITWLDVHAGYNVILACNTTVQCYTCIILMSSICVTYHLANKLTIITQFIRLYDLLNICDLLTAAL